MKKAIAKFLFETVHGWEFVGKEPPKEVHRCMFVFAPHTSNWDFYLALGFMFSLGVKFTWMMKKEAFFWPVGPLWKRMGGIPIDRRAKTDVSGQVSDWIKNADTVCLGITPEGTRTKVNRYKKGYLRIANSAEVPLFIVGLNAQTKEVVLDRIWPLTGDIKKDNAALKAYIDATFIGIHPEKA